MLLNQLIPSLFSRFNDDKEVYRFLCGRLCAGGGAPWWVKSLCALDAAGLAGSSSVVIGWTQNAAWLARIQVTSGWTWYWNEKGTIQSWFCHSLLVLLHKNMFHQKKLKPLFQIKFRSWFRNWVGKHPGNFKWKSFGVKSLSRQSEFAVFPCNRTKNLLQVPFLFSIPRSHVDSIWPNVTSPEGLSNKQPHQTATERWFVINVNNSVTSLKQSQVT